MVKTIINKILYNQISLGDNRSKDVYLSTAEKDVASRCDLRGAKNSQFHILNECTHATMLRIRRWGQLQIKSHILLVSHNVKDVAV